jgi:hypothetical protein
MSEIVTGSLTDFAGALGVSWLVHLLSLAFTAGELGAVGGAIVVASLVLHGEHSSRARGLTLLAAYAAAVGVLLLQ